MRNGHASVTHNVTCESQPPVPSRPYPARPALYIERGDFSIHLTLGDVALALGQQVIARFHKDGWNEVLVVDELGPCWEYRGLRSAYNYGVTRQVASHRLAVMLDGRDIPEGMHVLHACDNPPCVNPAHLSVGTRSDNMRDMVAKGRHRAPNGNYHHATKITDEQVREVRERYTRAWGEVTKLAAEYGISQNQMSWILQGKRRPEAGGPIHPPRMVRKSKSPGTRGQR